MHILIITRQRSYSSCTVVVQDLNLHRRVKTEQEPSRGWEGGEPAMSVYWVCSSDLKLTQVTVSCVLHPRTGGSCTLHVDIR